MEQQEQMCMELTEIEVKKISLKKKTEFVHINLTVIVQ